MFIKTLLNMVVDENEPAETWNPLCLKSRNERARGCSCSEWNSEINVSK